LLPSVKKGGEKGGAGNWKIFIFFRENHEEEKGERIGRKKKTPLIATTAKCSGAASVAAFPYFSFMAETEACRNIPGTVGIPEFRRRREEGRRSLCMVCCLFLLN